jgi:hypothetical protein
MRSAEPGEPGRRRLLGSDEHARAAGNDEIAAILEAEAAD